MIQLTAISKIFYGEGNDFAALKNVTLNITNGEYVLITGKSGSGKSTLLNVMTGIDRVSSGRIVIGGTDITALDEAGLTKWRGIGVGIVFQFFQLIPTLSVRENILLPMDLIGKILPGQREQKALELLKMVDMEDHADKMPGILSGGEQQRIAIARALANDSQLIVADEPTGNLDSANRDIVYSLLRDLHSMGKTIIMVTHDNDQIAGATRRIIMKDGRVTDQHDLKEVVSV